tara:strand:- start:28174 stop:29076 length:903 start_codon:yes stop_codon:yes gene_type:complete
MDNRARPENVASLRAAYNLLLQAQSSAIDSILDDGRTQDKAYPVYAPTICDLPAGKHGFDERIALANSIKNVFTTRKENVDVLTGLLCSSPNTVAKIESLNAAKIDLKDVITSIKRQDRLPDNTTGEIAADLGFRTSELRKAMREVGFAAVDLKRVYAQIRILEPQVNRVSWTWARKHTTYKKLSRKVIDQRIEELEATNPIAAKEATNVLRTMKKSSFSERFSLPPQLRINYSFGAKGSLELKAAPVSGVLIVQQKELPAVRWRDLKSIQDRDDNPRLPPKLASYKPLAAGWGVLYDAS